MKLTKVAHDELMTKIAAVEEFDRTQAFEIGFAKAAQDAGLTEAQYDAIRAYGIKKLEALRK